MNINEVFKFRFRSLNCTQTMDPYDIISVNFGYLPQLLQIWSYVLRSPLAKNAEYLRCFHSNFVIPVVQKLFEYRHEAPVNIRCICGDVF